MTLREKNLAGARVVASISGGKDSAAMSLWLREQGIEHDRIFLDTGWEHPATYEYLRGELTRVIGPIQELKGPRTMIELVRHKGMFPSRRIRFCSQELKVFPARAYFRERQAAGEALVNAVGIRAAESRARSSLLEWEWEEEFNLFTWRPLITWTESEVIDIHRRHGLKPNPLYMAGASRVGCWPCIMARKSEVKLVADTDPERIALMADLENELSARAGAPRTWFQSPEVLPIRDVVDWSRTDRGGRQFPLFDDRDPLEGCMRWGLCDMGAP